MDQVFFWVALLIVLAVIEIATLGLTTIWFAGGALIALIAAALGLPLFVQITLFLVVSVVLLVFTRPVAVKFFNTERVKTNVDSIVGQQAVVTEEIHNLKSTGRATLNGMEWTARSVDDNKIIPAGAVTVVRKVSGVKLLVEEIHQEREEEK